MVRLQRAQHLSRVSLWLIVCHLVVDAAKKDEFLRFVNAIWRERRIVSGALALSGNDMTFVAYDRLVVRGGRIYDELMPTHHAPVTRPSPQDLSRLV